MGAGRALRALNAYRASDPDLRKSLAAARRGPVIRQLKDRSYTPRAASNWAVRLVGVGLSGLVHPGADLQMTLFD